MNEYSQIWKAELDQLLSPQKIAIVGATEKIGPARNCIRCLLDMGFDGDIYPVHPNYDQVFGIKCYKNIFELPEKPDLVVVSVRAELVLKTIEQCEQLGIDAVTVFTSGFSELGAEGTKLQERMTEIANRARMKICGPNCLGHLDVINKTGGYSSSILQGTKAGTVAIVSQSGSMAISMYQAFKNLGVSHIISYGNQAVLDLSDYLMFLANDSNTKVITTFIEGVKNGQNFRKAIQVCRENRKAIVAIKIGKSEISKKIAMAHTAAMVGSDRIYKELFSEAKIFEVNDIDEMIQTVTAIVKTPVITKNGLAVMAISGGQCGIVGDMAEGIGLKIPNFSEKTEASIKTIVPPFVNVKNPLDVTLVGSTDYKDYVNVLKNCINDENIGVTAVMQDAPLGAGPSTVHHYSNITKAVMEVYQEVKKPIVVFTNHSTPYEPKIMGQLIDSGVPFLQGTKESLVAIKHLIDYYSEDNTKKTDENATNYIDWNDIRRSLQKYSEIRSYLGENEGKKILSKIEIPVTQNVLCTSVEDVEAAIEKIAGPVVLKIESPDIYHKTDVGGVALNLQGREETVRAYNGMIETVKTKAPEARISGILVQEMLSDGVDLIVGAHKDPQFGPAILFGLGGIYVEVFKDSSIGLVPITREKSREMIKASKAYNLLKAVRGREAMNIEFLVDIIVKISSLMEHCGDLIKEIDLNPVRINTSGAKVLDALIVLEKG